MDREPVSSAPRFTPPSGAPRSNGGGARVPATPVRSSLFPSLGDSATLPNESPDVDRNDAATPACLLERSAAGNCGFNMPATKRQLTMAPGGGRLRSDGKFESANWCRLVSSCSGDA
jgi:hypothetical protein